MHVTITKSLFLINIIKSVSPKNVMNGKIHQMTLNTETSAYDFIISLKSYFINIFFYFMLYYDKSNNQSEARRMRT